MDDDVIRHAEAFRAFAVLAPAEASPPAVSDWRRRLPGTQREGLLPLPALASLSDRQAGGSSPLYSRTRLQRPGRPLTLPRRGRGSRTNSLSGSARGAIARAGGPAGVSVLESSGLQ